MVNQPTVMVNQPPMVTNHYGNMGHGPIFFYNRDEPYYEFTNFYQAPIDLDGKTWPTTEHYFQAQKFIGTSYLEVIRNFDRPRQAFDLSRNPTVSRWRRKDWEDIKIDIMRKALLAKFTQHKPLRQMLLGTGDNMLVEHTPYDKFWGDGGDGSGQNHLGMLLMEIRHDLKTLQASLRKENDRARSRNDITPDSHRETPLQRSNSTEKDSPNGLSSSSSCSMDCTNSGADESNQSIQSHPNQDGTNSDLTRPPLHPTTTGSPPHQQLAATGGGASPQVNTPVPATNTGTAPSPCAGEPPRDPTVGDLIDLEPKPPEKDEVTSLIMDDVPSNLAAPLQPTSLTPSPCNMTTHAADQGTTPAAPDSCTDAGEGSSSSNEDDNRMDTN
jgi:ribA/ribD-fused uncharacterized protein